MGEAAFGKHSLAHFHAPKPIDAYIFQGVVKHLLAVSRQCVAYLPCGEKNADFRCIGAFSTVPLPQYASQGQYMLHRSIQVYLQGNSWALPGK